MKRGLLITIALASALHVISVPAAGEPMAAGGGRDIGGLMALAEEHYDLEKTDAVLLLDGLYIAFRRDGTRETTVHRILWISTELATETYADLRVPYNTATSTLEVLALRTWRDGRWWPHELELSPTAIVETTPRALITADDYTSIRETMLLHDGVEIPCILETAYTVTESRDPELGAFGLWLLPRTCPAVAVELSVSVPKGGTFHHRSENGAPEPDIATSDPDEDTYVWSVDLVDRLPRPLTCDQAAYVPHVEWSTWESGKALGEAIDKAFDAAAVLNDALRDSVADLIEHEPTLAAKARAIVAFVDETARHVDYDNRFWEFEPRPAVRTWETAYGHRLDRAVLAAALLREAGCNVSPAFVTEGYAREQGDRVPALGRYEGIGLLVSGDDLTGYYDPAAGRLELGVARLIGRGVWLVGGSTSVTHDIVHPETHSALVVHLTIEPDEDGGWTGTGCVRGEGSFSPYASVVGLDGEFERYVEQLLESVVPGAELDSCNLEQLRDLTVVAGFAFALADPEPDKRERIEIVAGNPHGGILEAMPGNVHLYAATRDSPVLLPGPMTQTVNLRLKPGAREVVRLPEAVEIENAAGRFTNSVEETDDGWVTLARELVVRAGSEEERARTDRAIEPLDAGLWPELRRLLLEESDPANRTIFLK